jgi:hypothetical protein
VARQQAWTRPIQELECPDGWSTGPPDFVGVGAQRCGTTWWYRGAIRPHPRFVRLAAEKEVQFFVRFWPGEVPPDFVERYHRLFPRPPGSITGEWTPRYMYDFWSPPLLREAAPEARLLVMLRDPVERYRSGIGREVRLADQFDYSPDIAIVGDAVHRSLYHKPIERILDLYPRDRVLILQYERCLADPLGEMQRTQRFLGLEPLDEVSRRLAREQPRATHKSDLPPLFRDELTSRLRDDLTRLAGLCPELDLSLWPTAVDLV